MKGNKITVYHVFPGNYPVSFRGRIFVDNVELIRVTNINFNSDANGETTVTLTMLPDALQVIPTDENGNPVEHGLPV